MNIYKIQKFTVFSEQDQIVYEFKRDSFSKHSDAFKLEKRTRRGKVIDTVDQIDLATAALILEQLLLSKQQVDIEYFSYTKEFQERTK